MTFYDKDDERLETVRYGQQRDGIIGLDPPAGVQSSMASITARLTTSHLLT